MAKKQSFAQKALGKDGKALAEYVKVVKAVRGDKGAWKFKTQMVAVTDENRNEVYGG